MRFLILPVVVSLQLDYLKTFQPLNYDTNQLRERARELKNASIRQFEFSIKKCCFVVVIVKRILETNQYRVFQ